MQPPDDSVKTQDHTLGLCNDFRVVISGTPGISQKLARSNVTTEKQNKHGGGLSSSAGCTYVCVLCFAVKPPKKEEKN